MSRRKQSKPRSIHDRNCAEGGETRSEERQHLEDEEQTEEMKDAHFSKPMVSGGQKVVTSRGSLLKCPLCAYTTRQCHLLSSHVLTHAAHPRSLSPTSSANTSDLASKTRFVSANEAARQCPVTCALCNRVFTSQRLLERHSRAVHSGHEHMGKCPICSLLFDNASSLDQHVRMHRQSLLLGANDVSKAATPRDTPTSSSSAQYCQTENERYMIKKNSMTPGSDHQPPIEVKPDLIEECYHVRDGPTSSNSSSRDDVMDTDHTSRRNSSSPACSRTQPSPSLHLHTGVGEDSAQDDSWHMVDGEAADEGDPEGDDGEGDEACVYCALCGRKCAHIVSLASHMYAVHGAGQGGYIDLGAMRVLPASINCSNADKYVINIDVQKDDRLSSDQSASITSRGSKFASSARPEPVGLWPSNDSPWPITSTSLGAFSTSDSSERKTFMCDHCNAKFLDFDTFQVHVRTLVRSHQQVACPLCPVKMTNDAQLCDHLVTHLASRSTTYACTACSSYFSSSEALHTHQMSAHLAQVYKCMACSAIFDTLTDSQLHLAAVHRKTYDVDKCQCCNREFTSSAELTYHIHAIHLPSSSSHCIVNGSSGSRSSSRSSCGQSSLIVATNGIASTPLPDDNDNDSERDLENTAPLYGPASGNLIKLLRRNMNGESQAVAAAAPSTPFEQSSLLPPPLYSRQLARSPSSSNVHKILMQEASEAHTSRWSKGRLSSSPLVVPLIPERSAGNGGTGNNKALTDRSQRGGGGAPVSMSMTSAGQYKCNICDKVLSSEQLLLQHKAVHSLVVTGGHTCFDCKQPIVNRDQFERHLHLHATGRGGSEGPMVRCIVCALPLLTAEEADVHASCHFPASAASRYLSSHLVPPSPSLRFGSHARGKSHSSASCSPERLTVSSSEALSLSTRSNRDLAAELPVVSSIKTSASPQVFQCIKCQQCFATETDIRQHVTTHLLQEGNRHECRLCDSSFESPAKLQCHLIEHSFIDGGDSELACSVCAATFSSAVDLQAHAVLHGMHARPYRCSQCSQAFFFSAELLNHAYCHSRDSTNGQHDNSDTTSMLFTASSALENDGGEITSKRLRLECGLCDGVFGSLPDLKAHLRRAHPGASKRQPTPGDTPVYTCDTCGTKFVEESDWRRHSNTHCALTSVSVTKNLTSLKNKKKKRKQTNVTSKKWLIKLPNNGSKHSSPCVVEEDNDIKLAATDDEY